MGNTFGWSVPLVALGTAGVIVSSAIAGEDLALKAKARVDRMDSKQACEELGRVLRTAVKTRSELATETMIYVSDKFAVGGDEWDAIGKRGVVVGMSECGVIAAWGRPSHVNQTTTAGGTSAQWVYRNRSYVYFAGSRVRTIQN